MKTKSKRAVFSSHGEDMHLFDVAVPLVPIVAWAFIAFGSKSLELVAMSAFSALFFEIVMQFILYRDIFVGDILSSALVGVIISLTLSLNVPYWLPIIGTFAAVIVAKYQFGLLKKYPSILSPVALGVFVCGLFPQNTNTFLDGFRAASFPDCGLLNLLVGNTEGQIGTVSALLLILGGLYLIFRGRFSVRTALAATVAFAGLSLAFFPSWTTFSDNLAYGLLSGGFFFYLFYIAGDRTASPVTDSGKLIYGLLFGALVFYLRMYTNLPACEALSVLVLSVLTPLLDFITKPSPFGGRVNKKVIGNSEKFQ